MSCSAWKLRRYYAERFVDREIKRRGRNGKESVYGY